FDTEKEATLKPGESMQIRNYTLKYLGYQTLQDPNKVVWQATMDVYVDGNKVKTIYPNKHYYPVQQQPTTEVVLRSTLKEDLYVVLAQPNEDKSAIFKVYINPLIAFVWLSGLVVTVG
ncbi:MAG: cytochrome C biogenesis protein, partial [Phototrophicales bacterium]